MTVELACWPRILESTQLQIPRGKPYSQHLPGAGLAPGPFDFPIPNSGSNPCPSPYVFHPRGSTTAPRKTTTLEKSSQMAKTKGRFTIISKGGGGGGGFKAAPNTTLVMAAASVPFSFTSTKSFCTTPIR